MRILLLSNRPDTRVGYGILMKNMLPYLKEHHDIALFTNWGIDGEDEIRLSNYPGIPFYGRGSPGYNEHLVKHRYDRFNADMLLVVWDPYALNVVLQDAHEGKVVFVPYYPIDTDSMTSYHKKACDVAYRIIPMSRHGEEIFKKNYPEKTLPHIPVGVDTDVFRPMWNSFDEKGVWKEKLGFSKDTFVIGLGGDIKGRRKRWAENMEGVKKFIQRNPRVKVGVFIQARDSPENQGDYNLKELVLIYGLQDVARMIEPIEYLFGVFHEELSEVYNGMDVFVQCSQGEGGGMQFIEAQACGTPVVGINYTSVPQMIGKESGMLVDPKILELDNMGALRAIPDTDQIALSIETLHNELTSNLMGVRDAGRIFAMKFDWKTVVLPLWKSTLEKIEEDIKKSCLKIPVPSKELLERGAVIKLLE